ncbi:hypothetical protein FKG94_16875 [Exilibacterium tricleocarpae]|uniref:Calx-beta domain-containing protein n=1 Tax=Exilibacterium tricleocarpae TaxID=2591008 RepID=A0A545TAN8_9GAMM|nr:Calx-beta domain-containing protein [Exilibacterium tricleocarpae]TQV74276.1 hypothetical protein FKG94_16875 [Exilibacterium tricleocarpae]
MNCNRVVPDLDRHMFLPGFRRRAAAFSVKTCYRTLLWSLVLMLLAGCGGGGSPSSAEQPVTDPVVGEELDILPQVSAGGRQFADPNVLVFLRGSASAAAGATITEVLWTQVSGPEVTIPDPNQLENAIVVPDLREETELSFRLTAQDSEGRVNASTAFLFVRPTGAFARVVGGTVDERDGAARFVVKLNAPQAAETVVNYATRSGTAEEGSDYLASVGSLSFAAGETEKTVTITIFDTDATEDDEYFNLDISVVSVDNPASNTGSMLIRNNPDPIAVNEIAFTNAGPITMVVGESTANPIDPATVIGAGAISYASSSPAVAGVDQQGLVTAVAVGTTTITAIKAADASAPSSTASYELTVTMAAETLVLPVVNTTRTVVGLALSSGTATVDWGDGSPTEIIENQRIEDLFGAGSLTHNYAQTTSGNVTIAFSDGFAAVKGFLSIDDGLQLDVEALSDLTNIEVISFFSDNSVVNGALASLSNNTLLRELRVVSRRGNFSGDISELPPAITQLTVRAQQGNFTGDIADIPDSMVGFSVISANTITGTVADIPAALVSFQVNGLNTVTGTVAEIPTNVTSFSVAGTNTISGNIEDLHGDLRSVFISGFNTIGGDLGLVRNNGTLSLSVIGNNTITAGVADIPATITNFNVAGNNTLFGNIEDLHPEANSVSITGNNTIAGNIDLLTNNSTLSITVGGANSITGTVAGISPAIRQLNLSGVNTLSGNIQDLHPDIRVFDISGRNTIAGDLGLLRADGLVRLRLSGDNAMAGFTTPPLWNPPRLDVLNLFAGNCMGFNSGQVDSLLIFLNNQLGRAVLTTASIRINRCGDGPRTPVSDTAVSELQSKGYFVATNEEDPI